MGFLAGSIGVPDDADIGVSAAGTGRLPHIVSAFISWGDSLADPTSAGELHFDVVLEENHSRTTEVTDHSVEEGTSFIDHVRPLPDRLSLEVFVSNSPINSPDFQLQPVTLDIPQAGQAGPLAFLNGGTSGLLDKGLQAIGLQRSFPTQLTVQVYKSDAIVDYVTDTYHKLTLLRNTATLLTVTTPHEFYSNMVLEKIEMRRDASTGTSANFSLDFRQIRIVTSNIVNAPLPSVSLPRAGVNVPQGKKDTQAMEQPLQSAAHLKKNGALPPTPAFIP